MSFYDLLDVKEQKHFTLVAKDRSEALLRFGQQVDHQLILEGGGEIRAPYLLHESEFRPHEPHNIIPVFVH